MAISFVNQANANTVNQAASLTINAPAGIQQGDILICELGFENGSSGPFTRDQTWNTAVANWFPSNTNGSGIVLWRLATASEPSTYKFTSSLNPDFIAGGIGAFRGVDNITPIDVAGTPSSTAIASSVTIVSPNSWLLFFAENDGAVTNTAPSGMTQMWSIPGSGTVEGACGAYEGPDAAGATGTRTAQTSTTGRSVLLALRPAIFGGFRKIYLPQYKHRQRHQFSIPQHVRIYHPKPAQYETLLVPVVIRPQRPRTRVHWKLPDPRKRIIFKGRLWHWPQEFMTLLVPVKPRPVPFRTRPHWKLPWPRDIKWNPLRRPRASTFNIAALFVAARKVYRPRWIVQHGWRRRRYERLGAQILAGAVIRHYRSHGKLPGRFLRKRLQLKTAAALLASVVRPRYRPNHSMSRWHRAQRLGKRLGSLQQILVARTRAMQRSRSHLPVASRWRQAKVRVKRIGQIISVQVGQLFNNPLIKSLGKMMNRH